MFVLCDSCGIIHNFEVYTGRIALPQNGPDLGQSSNIVIMLSEVVQVIVITCCIATTGLRLYNYSLSCGRGVFFAWELLEAIVCEDANF